MALKIMPIPPIATETASVTHAAFPHGSLLIQMRDVLGTLYASRVPPGLATTSSDNGCARVRVATDTLPLCVMQGATQQVPEPLEAETAKIVEHRLPGREVAGQVAPGTAGAHEVEDGVQDTAQWVRTRSASLRH
jgi:hypothetical protein